MGRTYRAVVEIHAGADRVIAVLSDVERWPEWNATTISVRRLDAGALRVGSRARVLQPKLKPATWRVTELDAHHFTWMTGGPGIRITGRHDIEPNANGCRVTLAIEMSGLLAPIAAHVAGDLTQQYVGMEAQSLKTRSEA